MYPHNPINLSRAPETLLRAGIQPLVHECPNRKPTKPKRNKDLAVRFRFSVFLALTRDRSLIFRTLAPSSQLPAGALSSTGHSCFERGRPVILVKGLGFRVLDGLGYPKP